MLYIIKAVGIEDLTFVGGSVSAIESRNSFQIFKRTAEFVFFSEIQIEPKKNKLTTVPERIQKVLRDDWLSPLCRDRITQTGLIQSFFFKFLFKLKKYITVSQRDKNKSFAVDMKWIKKGSLLFLKKMNHYYVCC